MWRLLERHDRLIERWYPWAGGLAAWLAAVSFLPSWAAPNAPGLVDPVINVAAIAVAFLVAVAVMLAALKAEPVIRELQRIDAFPVLLGYLRSAIYVWGAVIIVGLLIKAVPTTAVAFGSAFMNWPAATATIPRVTWIHILTTFWVATLVAGALAGHRIVRVLFALLRYRDPRLARPAPPPPPEDDEAFSLPAERRRRAAG